MPRTPVPTEERFDRYVLKTKTCWLWTGAIMPNGYGHFIQRLATNSYRQGYAHRFSYERYKGAIPPGDTVDHLCRVRNCVRPEHLEACSRAENINRGLLGVLKTHCVKGHELTEDNIYRPPRGRRQRQCRTCRNESMTRFRREHPNYDKDWKHKRKSAIP